MADVTTDKPYLLLIYAFLERESPAGPGAGLLPGGAAGAAPGQILAVCVATGDERLYANLLLTVGFLTPSS